ncbi:hypothetical protein SAMN05518863_104358 [Candidatus Pantoea symbiotica]|uniref:Uncharacterized protein n=1 Tax=Candidatus Pantoea symbiotica TaxID=1884370 RepID=A0A1I3WRL2_9GAMM|nr:hypothetical protein SAMN05518863_104358 [Pantoea symbiotica]SFU75033.1 hypothetical protein SAMN05518864_104358 [Pantoea sp. YR525]
MNGDPTEWFCIDASHKRKGAEAPFFMSGEDYAAFTSSSSGRFRMA